MREGVCKIADFGFAIKATSIFKDIRVGSPVYMSPEGLIQNLYGPKTDVWSFGLMIYELLHGTTPLAVCRTEEELMKKMLEPISYSSAISKDLTALLEGCLKINEKERLNIQDIAETLFFKKMIKPSKDSKMEDEALKFTSCSTGTNLSFSIQV